MNARAPMLIPLTGLIFGIIVILFGLPVWVSCILALSGIAVYLFLLRVNNNPVNAFKTNKYHYVWLFLIFAALGSFITFINTPTELENIENIIALKGRIKQITQPTSGDKAIIEIHEVYDKSGKTQIPKNMNMMVRSDALESDVDDIIVFPVKLLPVEDNPNYFSSGYSKYLINKGILYQSFTEGTDIKTIGHQTTFSGIATKIRNRIESLIEYSDISKKTQDFLITILVGDRSYLDPELRNRFADAGLSHILALSGMHVAIICGIVLWLLFPFNFFGHYRLRMITATLMLFIYAFITGWNPSTVRATIMIAAMTACMILERKNSSWNSLLLATFIILIFNPYALNDIGLQLSFLCVASLIFFVNQLNPIDRHNHPRLYKLASLIITTLVATGATWCVTAYYFGKIPLVFLPANILILPLLPFYLTISLIYLILHGFGLNITPLSRLLDAGYSSFESLVGFLSNQGTSSVNFSPSSISVILWLLFVATLAFYMINKSRKSIKWISPGIFGIFILSLFITDNPIYADGFIVQSGWRNIKVLSRLEGKENLHQPQRKAVSNLQIKNHKIAVIDTSLPETVDTTLNEYDEIIICGNCKEDIASVLKKYKTDKIILHTTLRKKRESELMQEADSLGVKCHSIRNSGPYRIDL